MANNQCTEKRSFAIVGMSPGNGYFKKETIGKLLIYCSNRYESVKIMIPEIPAIHTYRALGYTEPKAKKKARLNSNTLKNHSQNTIEQYSLKNIEIVDWKIDINNHPEYEKELNAIDLLYQQNNDFYHDTRKASQKVIENKVQEEHLERAKDESVKYLLEELAFIQAAPKMFNQNSVEYVYHKEWPIFEKHILGEYDGKEKNNLIFHILKESI